MGRTSTDLVACVRFAGGAGEPSELAAMETLAWATAGRADGPSKNDSASNDLGRIREIPRLRLGQRESVGLVGAGNLRRRARDDLEHVRRFRLLNRAAQVSQHEDLEGLRFLLSRAFAGAVVDMTPP
jgi:hypothetical protein